MTLKECIMTNSTCYKQSSNSDKTGIVVHSTGCNNKYIKRYVQPLTTYPNYAEIIADIGKNKYNNDWNHKKRLGGVHAFVGCNKDGKVETYKVLPYERDAWGVGRGRWIYAGAPYYSNKSCTKKVGNVNKAFMGNKNIKSYSCISFVEDGKTYYVPYKYCGSYNYAPNSRIQFEICEDNLKDEKYFLAAMKEAQEYCAYLCEKYGWGIDKISSHGESITEGFGQDHEDPLPWLKKFGKNMDWFRAEVQKILDGDTPEPSDDFKVGDKVMFTGNTHYTNANATKGKACTSGIAEITAISKGAKHPYHLVAAKDSKSNVYGWVDAANVHHLDDLAVGDKVRLDPDAVVYGTNKKFSPWVYKQTLYVRKIVGDKITVSVLKVGATTGSVDRKYLVKV